MSNEEFQKLVLEKFTSLEDGQNKINARLINLEKEVKEIKTIVLRTEEQTKENTEFITAIKQIAKQ